MTYRKGFFIIEVIYSLLLISFLVAISLSQYAQVIRVLQQMKCETEALTIALNEIEQMRISLNTPLSDIITHADFTVHRTVSFEALSSDSTIAYITVSLFFHKDEIMMLTTGVLCE